MWRQIVTWHWSCFREPTDYENSPTSGFNIQNTVISVHSSQHRMNGPFSSASWKSWGHSDFGPCGWPRGILSHFILLSQSTMTYSIIWMASCELWPRRWLNGRKNCSLPRSKCNRRCTNIVLKLLQQQVCFSFLHKSLMHSGWCDRFGSGTREWILIFRTRHPMLYNTRRHLWSKWTMNRVITIDVCQSINPKAYQATMYSPPQWLQDPVNDCPIHRIWPEMEMHTRRQTIWLRRQMEQAIAQLAYWPHPGSIWLHCLTHQRTRGKLFQISMITTLTQWRLAVCIGCQI